ncbi:hypothetical protein GCM10020229_09630 [Kitasatospora albolonga]|uniref:hypothetical protein n=1 Tax=Kitasatospora albolonga TaxID=68173 RepID=UPI0031E8FCE4
MTPRQAPCGSPHPQRCAVQLRHAVIEATGWSAVGPVLTVGARAADLARSLAERHSPVLALTTLRSPGGIVGPHVTRLTGDPLLLPTLGLPALSLALVSGYPPSRAAQLLLDLDVLLRPGAKVVFVPDRLVPELLPYMGPAAESPFHRLRAEHLAHAHCTGPETPGPTAPSARHGVITLVADRPGPACTLVAPPAIAPTAGC